MCSLFYALLTIGIIGVDTIRIVVLLKLSTLTFFVFSPQHPEVAEFLLDNGADIDGRNASGNTALQFACIKGDIRLASLLIDRGADVFAQSSDKGTAIDYAEGASMFLGVAFHIHLFFIDWNLSIYSLFCRRSRDHCP